MKITLCGSTRFADQYKEVNAFLTLRGHVVYSVAVLEKQGDAITDDDKRHLDLVHLKKILESDAIIVVGYETVVINGETSERMYIGDSTRREIEWAQLLGKFVHYAYNVEYLDVLFPPVFRPI